MKKGGTTVLSSLTKSLEAFCQGLFSVIGKFVPITLKNPRESHCGGVESCRKSDPPQAENPASGILFYIKNRQKMAVKWGLTVENVNYNLAGKDVK